MNEAVIPFVYDDSLVRVIDRSGDPWWVLTDVCGILAYRMASDASRRLDEDEKGTHILRTLGGSQEMTIINESGLWALVLTSRKPAAKRFNGVAKRDPTAKHFKGAVKRRPLSTHQSVLNEGLCA